jgi:8-oxo-dGTP pyrophosphatase MutT (NUDIX family)
MRGKGKTMSSKVRQKVQVWIYAKIKQPTASEASSVATADSCYFLLLLTRAERGSFWQPVTGSVEEGEGLETAAAREAREETSLKFVNPPQPVGVPFEFESRGNRISEYSFSLEVPFTDERKFPAVTLDPHEHVDYKWVPADEAFQKLKYPSNQEILRALLAELSKTCKS